MMKREFEQLIGDEISQEAYEKVETVYMNYPGIHEKQQIAYLFRMFGMVIITDLYPRAVAIQAEIVEMNRLETKINYLRNGGKLK